jgi:hypothetical protein
LQSNHQHACSKDPEQHGLSSLVMMVVGECQQLENELMTEGQAAER